MLNILQSLGSMTSRIASAVTQERLGLRPCVPDDQDVAERHEGIGIIQRGSPVLGPPAIAYFPSQFQRRSDCPRAR